MLTVLLPITIYSDQSMDGNNIARSIKIPEWGMIPVTDEKNTSIECIEGIKPDKSIKTGKLIKSPLPTTRGFRHIWFTADFTIESDPDQYYGISLGRIYHTDRTYINGWPIGGNAADELYNIHHPRNYPIPKGLLRIGKNTITVLIGIHGREYGGINGDVLILPEKSFKLKKIKNETVFMHIPIGIAIFLFGQTIFHLMFFVWNRREMVNLYAAILFFIWGFFVLALFTPYYPFDNSLRISFIWSLISFVSLLFVMIIQANYRVYLLEYNRIIVPALLISGIVSLFSTNTDSVFYPARILGTTVIFCITPFLAYLIIRVNKIRPSKNIYVLFLFGLIPGLFILWDVVNYLWVWHYPPLMHPYALPVFIICVMILIIREYISNRIKLDTLYAGLKNQAEKEGKKTITPEAEEKFERIISFLKENYTSDISREGLAEAVDLSSDHMSRNFKTYTGMRIGDYINCLRIRDASVRLADQDKRIIDIAFEVGFESLTTFNRVFAKIMQENPTEYRKRTLLNKIKSEDDSDEKNS